MLGTCFTGIWNTYLLLRESSHTVSWSQDLIWQDRRSILSRSMSTRCSLTIFFTSIFQCYSLWLIPSSPISSVGLSRLSHSHTKKQGYLRYLSCCPDSVDFPALVVFVFQRWLSHAQILVPLFQVYWMAKGNWGKLIANVKKHRFYASFWGDNAQSPFLHIVLKLNNCISPETSTQHINSQYWQNISIVSCTMRMRYLGSTSF